MVFFRKEYFTAVNNRVAVGKTVDVPVKYYSLSDKIRIIQIVAALYIITYVVTDDYFIRITGKVYVGQNIHIDL
jgi:hypothetical protein